MALQVDNYKTVSGVLTPYWAIATYNCDKCLKTLTANIYGWISEDAKKVDFCSKQDYRTITCGPNDFDLYFSGAKIAEFGDIETAIYNYAKAKYDFFKTATDLI